MTESQYTPAPWRISDNPKAPYLVYGSNNYAVADCKVYHGKTDIGADMRLIAAAPELLDALIAADNLLAELGHSLPNVKEAIAKAREQNHE